MNNEKKPRNGTAGLKIRNICLRKARRLPSPLAPPFIFGFSHKPFFQRDTIPWENGKSKKKLSDTVSQRGQQDLQEEKNS